MSKISGELLGFVSLAQGKYQNTRETCCCCVESHAGDVLLLFPVPFSGNHLNSCYSWPDIDFRVILRLDQLLIWMSHKESTPAHIADVGFLFVRDLCHCICKLWVGNLSLLVKI